MATPIPSAAAALGDRPVFDADPLNLFIVVEGGDHHVTILDGGRLEPIRRFPSGFVLHGGPKFSPDGRFLAVANNLPHLGSGIPWRDQGRPVMATPHLKEGKVSIIDRTDWRVIKTIETLGPGKATRPAPRVELVASPHLHRFQFRVEHARRRFGLVAGWVAAPGRDRSEAVLGLGP